MARLWSSGAELNSTAANVEFTSNAGTVSIVTSPVRSGTYAVRSNPTASFGNVKYAYRAAATQESVFIRFYLRIGTLPSASTNWIFDTTGVGTKMILRMTSGGALQLYNAEDSAQVGSNSSALSVDTWYRIEVGIDTTTLASTVTSARIDGVEFASGTVNLGGAINSLTFGINQAGVTADLYYDDMAINDSTGSFQNSYPGAGEIIHLRPNAAGDNNQWDTDLASGDANNYQRVDEVTPDDVTSYIASATLDQIDDYNIDATPAALASDDTINVVQVGVRFAVADATSTDPDFVLRIKASASGTVEESAAIDASSTSWRTNAISSPSNYKLTLYDLPGASTTAWTKSTLDTTQIGVRQAAADAHEAWISTLWLLVEHKPADGGGGSGRTAASSRATASSRSGAASRSTASSRTVV